ncbi:MAG TPA: PilZ domain-containing protein [Verrucomicrobiae bacterium]|nr:PilZ domain-containing protein [Verrucomicrobiae bacterium]
MTTRPTGSPLAKSLDSLSLDGRAETRIRLGALVYLVKMDEPFTTDLVRTENVSAHGAGFITKKRWLLDSNQRIALLSGKFQLQARVVYFQPNSGDTFRVGLAFHDPPPNWWEGC